MKSKKILYSEFAYVLGILTLAFGTALMTRADFGLSMVVAPAYLLHLKISQYIPAFSFGMAEYIFQAFLLIVLSVVLRKFKKSYLFSFITAVLYGLALDLFIFLIGFLPLDGMVWRIVFFIIGLLFCTTGIALFFRTYLSTEAYEMFVKDLSVKWGWNINHVKMVYDCCSLALSIILSFAFFGFGHFEGIKAGTVVCTVANGFLIGGIGKFIDTTFDLKDALPLRDKFNH